MGVQGYPGVDPQLAQSHQPAFGQNSPLLHTAVAPRIGWNPEEGFRNAEAALRGEVPGFDSEAHRRFMRSLG